MALRMSEQGGTNATGARPCRLAAGAGGEVIGGLICSVPQRSISVYFRRRTRAFRASNNSAAKVRSPQRRLYDGQGRHHGPEACGGI
jgi:hypothetical protein